MNNEAITHLKYDLPAAVVVFLVSITMSLGIALASGAPLFSGLITAIIGGILVSILSQSAVGISGTSAGMSILVFSVIQELGFQGFLLTLVIAGIVQILLGSLRAGIIAYYFPSSVINGMLAGIGAILFLKQIPHAIGYDRDYEGDFSFLQADHYSSFTELFHAIHLISPTAIIIACISLTILILWEKACEHKLPYFQLYQGILLTVGLGIIINQSLNRFYPQFALKSSHLVSLPAFSTLSDFEHHFQFPDFNLIQHSTIYLSALTIALVASLETLLCVEAVDKLDIYRRVTPKNRELIAQGIANICSGLLGGLPLTQLIVRSSINVQSGAKTKLANFLQGLLMLITILWLPQLLNQIPLATLASVLLVVSYKMINPSVFKKMYQASYYHFIPFCATVLGLIFTDLLTGLVIGLTIASFAILLENYKSTFYFREAVIGNKTFFRLSEQVSFLNKANIKRTLDHVPAYTEVVIDATRCKFMDYDVYEIIEDFKKEAAFKHIQLTLENMRGFGVLKPVQSVRSHTHITQKLLTPFEVLTILRLGNQHFINNLQANRNFLEQVNDTRQGQFPIAIILSCMDSRTSVELIFDQGLGDIFSVRIAGNVINDDILGSMEYACKMAGSKLIVVLGHSHCGAIKGAYANVQLSYLSGLLNKIQPAIVKINQLSLIDEEQIIQKIAEENVRLTAAEITQRSSVLAELVDTGDIAIVGGMYDIETGKVTFFEAGY
jgi:MFS superfamily sulfate permease-like transporter